MKADVNAETECLDHEQFRSPTPSINSEAAGCSSRTSSPARQTSTPSPATPFYTSTGQNQAQENTSDTTYGNAGLLDSAAYFHQL